MTPRRRPSTLGERITWRRGELRHLTAERRTELEQQLRADGLSEEEIAEMVAIARGESIDDVIRDRRGPP